MYALLVKYFIASIAKYFGTLVPKYSINLTRYLIGIFRQTKSVGRAIIFKYNHTCFLSMTAAPCLFNNRADEYLI